VTDGVDRLAAAVAAEPWCVRCSRALGDDGGLDVVVGDLAAARVRVPVLVAGLGLGLRRFDEVEASLEDVFVDLVGAGR
jgi:hypothetical protein